MAYIYINGQLIKEEKASIPIDNLGVQRGFGIFDLFRSRGGTPTFIEDYLNRFDRSQSVLHFDRAIEKEEIRQAVRDLQDKNQFADSTFKLMLLADGTDTDVAFAPFFYILNKPIEDRHTMRVGKVTTHEYVRENPLIKSINYMTSYMLHREKMKAGAVDVIYHHEGIISEASRSNLFIVKDGVLATPSRNILHGITRLHIMKFASELMTLEERDITFDEMLNADEVFISSTLKEIMPIVEIDGTPVGAGKAGPVSSSLWKSFQEYITSYDG